jgi:ABC-type polysaccharide/polyol phosphate export permease
MNTLYTVIVVVFVLSVLAIAAYALFELSPFAHHNDRFRDPQTGKRLAESLHLTPGWSDET